MVTSGIENVWYKRNSYKCGAKNQEERTKDERMKILLGRSNTENRIIKFKRAKLARH